MIKISNVKKENLDKAECLSIIQAAKTKRKTLTSLNERVKKMDDNWCYQSTYESFLNVLDSIIGHQQEEETASYDFESLEVAYVVIFERDRDQPWKSNGSFIPETPLEGATVERAIENVDLSWGRFGKAFIAKLEYISHDDAWDQTESISNLVAACSGGGHEDGPIILEKIGNDLPEFAMGDMWHSRGGVRKIKLMKIVEVESYTGAHNEYFKEKKTINDRKLMPSNTKDVCIHGCMKSKACAHCEDGVPF